MALPPDPDDPFRSGDWRWARARWLRETGRYFKDNRDDPETAVIKKFQVAQSKCKTDMDRYNVRRKFPGLYWAEQVHERIDNKTRYAIEARILARESFTSIAKKCNVTEETVFWYEKAFFNAMPKLENSDYVALTLIGSRIVDGLRERDFDILWKLCGYRLGSDALDMTINPFGPPQLVTGPTEVRAGRAEIFKNLYSEKALTALATWPVAYAQREMIELWLKLVEIEKSGGADAGSLILTNISAAIGSLPFSTSPIPVAQEALGYYDGQKAELRANELLLVANGKDSQELRQAVTNPFPSEVTDGHEENHEGS